MGDTAEILEGLAAAGGLRTLRTVERDGKYIVTGGRRYLDMSSNDYLGLCGETDLQDEFLREATGDGRFLMSNPASRLMTGNSADYDAAEDALARLYPGRRVLIGGSGYALNSALLPAVAEPQDAVVADKLVHASIVDGLRLCRCPWRRFNHNDANHLESIVKKLRSDGVRGDIWVATESVFSMDGDIAPLRDIVSLKERYGLKLYLDEAHAFGVFGPSGAGVAAREGLSGDFDVLVGTLGKAAASCGGFAATDSLTRELLINKMRTAIFSTALPPLVLRWTEFIVRRMAGMNDLRSRLHGLAAGFGSATQIIPIMAPGNENALAAADALRDAGYWVTAIRHPTVPAGAERIRVSLTAAMTEEETAKFREVCERIL